MTSNCFTDNSQPYEHKRPFRLGDDWVEYEQRPYVSFTMSALHGWDIEPLALLSHQPDILVQASTFHPYELIPGSDKQVVVSRDRIAKTTKDLRSTAWESITMALTDVDISNEEFFCLDSLKRSEPVVFVVASPTNLYSGLTLAAVRSSDPRLWTSPEILTLRDPGSASFSGLGRLHPFLSSVQWTS